MQPSFQNLYHSTCDNVSQKSSSSALKNTGEMIFVRYQNETLEAALRFFGGLEEWPEGEKGYGRVPVAEPISK